MTHAVSEIMQRPSIRSRIIHRNIPGGYLFSCCQASDAPFAYLRCSRLVPPCYKRASEMERAPEFPPEPSALVCDCPLPDRLCYAAAVASAIQVTAKEATEQ